MRELYLFIFVIYLLSGISQGQWTIAFYQNGLCNGTAFSQINFHLDDTSCHDDFGDNAIVVWFKTTSPREQIVAFYQFPGCYTEDEIAVSNVPICVGATYSSFKVADTYKNASGGCLDAAVSEIHYPETLGVSRTERWKSRACCWVRRLGCGPQIV